MNPVFLEKYQHELKMFREASKEFAKEHPKIAGHLGLSAPDIEDPYVERLIEAVSFLTARIDLKIDSQYPHFLEHLFKVIQPTFTRIIPSSGMVSVQTDESKPFIIPKYTKVSTLANKQGGSVCQFSTCHDVQIAPIKVAQVRYARTARKENHIGVHKSQLNLSINFPESLQTDRIDFDKLHFCIHGVDYYTATELLYQLSTKCTALQVRCGNLRSIYTPQISLNGFDFNLDIYGDRQVSHLKHLIEYSTLPEKYLFFSLKNFEKIVLECIKHHKSTQNTIQTIELDLTFFLDDTSSNIEKYLTNNAINLNSILITNAFIKRTRFVLDSNVNEQHIIIDKVRTRDYEVIGIRHLEGFNTKNTKIKAFEPIYKVDSYHTPEHLKEIGFFTESYRPSHTASTVNSYKGSECYLTISNQYYHIKHDDLNQLSVEAWCSNRALVREINWALDDDLVMDDAFKIKTISRLCRFTEPLNSPLQTVELWRLMNLVSANFIIKDINNSQSLTNQIKSNLFTVYEISKNEAFRSQIDAIISIEASFVSQNFKHGHRLLPLNGICFDIILDEALMSHAHPYIWGKILLCHLKGFSSINTFTKLIIRNKKKEIIANYNSLEEQKCTQ